MSTQAKLVCSVGASTKETEVAGKIFQFYREMRDRKQLKTNQNKHSETLLILCRKTWKLREVIGRNLWIMVNATLSIGMDTCSHL